jgi:hypothetical protein
LGAQCRGESPLASKHQPDCEERITIQIEMGVIHGVDVTGCGVSIARSRGAPAHSGGLQLAIGINDRATDRQFDALAAAFRMLLATRTDPEAHSLSMRFKEGVFTPVLDAPAVPAREQPYATNSH